MKKKNRLLALAALILAAAALALSVFALSTVPEDQTHLIDDLYRENQELRGRIDELNARLDQLLTVVSLENWTLDVAPWADGTGADITFTAVPTQYQNGISATFLVLLEGREVASIPCQWDGTKFSTVARLDAADGYSYYCVLAAPGGQQQLPLTTVQDPVQDIPVYLASSLDAYCNLAVSDWIEGADALTLTDAYAHVQLPRISAGGQVEIRESKLILRLNGVTTLEFPIDMQPSEVEGSYELAITGVLLPVNGLEDGDEMQLSLEVSLSDGRNLNAFGISWYLVDGVLSSAVG